MRLRNIDVRCVRCITFAATCSLAVFLSGSSGPVSVRGPDFKVTDHNVMLWMDQRAAQETRTINATGHPLLKYLGGSISILMEISKVLWLKNNMPSELFERCTFYDLHDALSYIATGGRTFPCSSACKDDTEPLGLGVDGTVKGWSTDFLESIGLQCFVDDDFRRVGGVCRVRP